MKTHQLRIALIGVLLILPLSEALAQQGAYKLGHVLGLRYFTLTKGDQAAYEQRVQDVVYPFYDTEVPGQDWVLMKGDRGDRSGKYAYFQNFDTLERRDFYFPQEQAPWPEWDAVMEKWNAKVGEGRFSDFEFDISHAGDFVLIGAETVKEMPWVGVLGIHHITIKAGQEKAFEQFVAEKWNPHSHLPGWWVLYYKADRGDGGYILVHALEQKLLRDAYFPEGQASELSQQATRHVDALWEELNGFVEERTEWSDFFVIR